MKGREAGHQAANLAVGASRSGLLGQGVRSEAFQLLQGVRSVLHDEPGCRSLWAQPVFHYKPERSGDDGPIRADDCSRSSTDNRACTSRYRGARSYSSRGVHGYGDDLYRGYRSIYGDDWRCIHLVAS